MAVRYGLWDIESGNNLGFYATQDAALAVVRQELHAYGREAVMTLALDYADAPTGDGLVAEGAGLVALAESAAPPVLPVQDVQAGTPTLKLSRKRIRHTSMHVSGRTMPPTNSKSSSWTKRDSKVWRNYSKSGRISSPLSKPASPSTEKRSKEK